MTPVPRVFTVALDAGAGAATGVANLGLGACRQTMAVGGDVAGRLLVRSLREALEWRYTEQALDLILRSPAAEHAVDSALAGPLVDAVTRAAGENAVVERIAAQVLDSRDFERVVMDALESEAVERLVGRVIESQRLDDVVQQLLQSDELWRFVEGIVRNPVVTDAVTATSRGLAGEVGEQVRDRSRGADAWLERVARRVSLHRHADDAAAGRLATGDP
jgi:hypothetical protein